MDKRNRKKRLMHVLKSSIAALLIVFVGVPLFAAIGEGNQTANFVLLVLIVGSYSTLYLR